MRNPARLALAAALVVCACDRSRPAPTPPAPSPSARPAAPAATTREVERLTGAVTPANAAAFAERVSAREGQIIGLKLSVEPGSDAAFKASRYMAEPDSDLFVISTGDGNAEGDGWEVTVANNEASYLHGVYVIDGFYTVKAGGMHQGIIAYSLQKVDDAAVLLNPAVKIADRPLP